MRGHLGRLVAALIPMLAGTCVPRGPGSEGLPIETSFAFTNFSQQFYAVLGVRAHVEQDDAAFFLSPLLPPGATDRIRFLDALGIGCPDSVDLRVWLYRRVRDDLPIGMDEEEQVDTAPLVAGEVLNIPACATRPLETYTIVNWDAPPGSACVKIAQGTPIDEAIQASGLFPNPDAAWELAGVDAALASTAPPPLAEFQAISGLVTLADGQGVEGIGVLIRTRFRVRLDDDDPANDPDAGYGEPIDWTLTDASGGFVLTRPAGAYQVEFFSDDYAFRPAVVEVETPLDVIAVIAEPL